MRHHKAGSLAREKPVLACESALSERLVVPKRETVAWRRYESTAEAGLRIFGHDLGHFPEDFRFIALLVDCKISLFPWKSSCRRLTPSFSCGLERQAESLHHGSALGVSIGLRGGYKTKYR